ncbi:hypothetical protein [Pseudomonas palmensis]|uniref:hypothetical protein n=1 Tax=Pseudomonas palmensis TaxID=2815362 RepID=UPI001AEB185F|nr:hypothetical protein [Pseudomonas palmensis]
MPLTKPNQELYEDLDGHAATLDWIALEVIEIARRINDAGLPDDAMALLEVSKTLRGQHEVILDIADDVQDGLIARSGM